MGKAKGAQFTDKQAAFIREYCLDKNATQAAIRAGYSAKTAAAAGDRLLRNVSIRSAVDELLAKLATNTETESEWIRRRLKEEADDYSEFATHSGRIRALELLGKVNGIFEKDNKQKADPLTSLLKTLQGNVVGPVGQTQDDDEEP